MIIAILINFIKQFARMIQMINFPLNMKIPRYISIVVMILFIFLTKVHIYIIMHALVIVLIKQFLMMITEFANITILII